MFKNCHNSENYAVNLITPYIIENPLTSQECNVTCTQGLVSVSDISHQYLTTDFLARESVAMHKSTVTSLAAAAATNSHLLDHSIVIKLPTPLPSVDTNYNKRDIEEEKYESNNTHIQNNTT